MSISDSIKALGRNIFICLFGDASIAPVASWRYGYIFICFGVITSSTTTSCLFRSLFYSQKSFLMQKILSIEPRIGYQFEANNKTYIIEDKLSIIRSVEASKLELELFDLTANKVKNQLIQAYNDLNQAKMADASVKIHNLVSSFDKNLQFKELPVLRYCALYINEKGEDRRVIDKEMIETKIQDWQEGGYDLNGFFLLVLSVLPSVRKDYIKYIQDTSKDLEKKANEKKGQ